MKYINFGNKGRWRYVWIMRDWCGIFKNLPHVKPGRWGFYIGGLEVGSRQPDDKVGVWLINKGLWRW